MKTKKSLKRITAVLMSFVLLATSLPLVFSANANAYDPAPYFTGDAQQKGAAAWVDNAGDLQIRFPSATGKPTHKVWSNNHDETANVKAITEYIVELSELGGKLEKHTAYPATLMTKTVSAADVGTGKLSAVITEAEIEAKFAELGKDFDIVNNRYNIAITAVDSEGWCSLPLHALVFDVPEFQFDMSNFKILSEENYALRELLRFEEDDGKYSGYQQTGDSVKNAVRANSVGAADPGTNKNTWGYRIHITSKPGANGQTLDTGESRQTWNFVGAKEVWYYLDLSDVELQGISFRLRSNYKAIRYNNNGKRISSSENFGTVVYSTLGSQYHTYGAGEKQPYILAQDENGNWEEIPMTNGTVDLGHFKGYVRIPIQFFCSETETQVTARNTWFGDTKPKNWNDRDTAFTNEVSLTGVRSDWEWINNNQTDFKGHYVSIDAPGTPISEALLVQTARMYYADMQNWPNNNKEKDPTWSFDLGTILAPGIDNEDIGKTADAVSRRATLVKDASDNWVVQNRENGYKAIEDIYSAGIAYQSVSDDSVNQSFFMDNIMFYNPDKNPDGSEFMWVEANLGGAMATGTKVETYFDQFTDAQDRILDAIDEYIGSPTWTDYRGVRYVDAMIKTFYDTYKAAYDKNETKKNPDDYFKDDKLQVRAAATNRAQTWTNYKTAKDLCGEAELLNGNNARPTDLVPMLVQSLEKLPDPSQVTTIKGDLYAEIIKCYQAYTRLNYGQLKMFGSYTQKDESGNKMLYEEDKILRYAQLLADQLANSTVTGYKMANYPFIPFNTFENNTEVGDRAWHLEDDSNYVLNGINGNTNLINYSQYKNFTSFATDKYNDTLESELNIRTVYANTDVFAHAAESEITANGYKNTNGYTTTIKSSALQLSTNVIGAFYLSRISKDSISANADFDAFKANNMGANNLGGLTMSHGDNDAAMDGTYGTTYLPFSLMMYVDFSDMSAESSTDEFFLSFKIHSVDNNGNIVTYFPGMGSNIGGKEWYRTCFVMNQTTGEWEKVYISTNGLTSGVRYFPSKSTQATDASSTISLVGYKGYIAIPMCHFKRGNRVLGVNPENIYLMEDSNALNNIYSVEVGFTAANGKAANFANKSFTIDNIGFTYDPDFYKLKGKNLSDRNDQTYAETFDAKSSKATEFEEAVAAIDPYDDTTLKDRIEVAKSIYGGPEYKKEDGTDYNSALGQWQKENIETVKQAKALLDKYIDHLNGVQGAVPGPAMSVDALKTAIENLPAVPANAVKDNPLPEPGFIREDGALPTEAGEVNYGKFGFTQDQAKDIIALYTDTYKRLSTADKESLGEQKDTLLNAYNAAMRCAATLETIKDKGKDFSEKLKTVYTRYNDGTDDNPKWLNFIKTTEKGRIMKLSIEDYEPLPYYAKIGLSEGSLIPAYKNMTDGIGRYFANTVMNDDGTEIVGGGIKVLMDKYTALYVEVKTELDAKRVLLKDLADRINDAVSEYNDLIPAYKNVFELYYGSNQYDAGGEYQGIKDILELFPRYDTAFATPDEGSNGTSATLALNSENEHGTATPASQTLNVNYIEEFPVETGGAVNTYFTIEYDGSLLSGTDPRNYELYLNGKLVPKVTDGGEPVRITDEMLGGALKNNTYTSAEPYQMVFTAKLTDKRSFTQQGTDTVLIRQYRPADPAKGETDPVLVNDKVYELNISYTPSEAYTVTIPAEFPVDWGDTSAVDVSYTVDCVLGTGKELAVYVEGKDGFLTAEDNSAYTMNYTAAGFGTKTKFTGVHTNAKPATKPTVQISDETWKESPVGKYKDTLTYTVEYTKS